MPPIDRRAVLLGMGVSLLPLYRVAAQIPPFGAEEKHKYVYDYLTRKFPNDRGGPNSYRARDVVAFTDRFAQISSSDPSFSFDPSPIWKKAAEAWADWQYDPNHRDGRSWEFPHKFQLNLTDQLPADPIDRANFEKYGWYIPQEYLLRQKGDNNRLYIYSEATADQILKVMRYSLDQAGLPLKHIMDTLNKKFPGNAGVNNITRMDEVTAFMNKRASSEVPPEQGREAMKKLAEAWIGWKYGADGKNSCLVEDRFAIKFSNRPADLTAADMAEFNRQGWVIPGADTGQSSKTLYMRPNLTADQMGSAMKTSADHMASSNALGRELANQLDPKIKLRDCTTPGP